MATAADGKSKRHSKPPREQQPDEGTPHSLTSATNDSLLEIDGSVMEGGGEILRITIAASCILRQSVRVTKIRAGRDKPGLRPQHLSGIQLVSQLCGGRLAGDHTGSSEVTFDPGLLVGGEFTADTHTAGSVCLLQQVALPCLLYASKSSRVILRGGTNADMAPPIDYMREVFQPMAAKFGVQVKCQLKRRGFYPKGGGEVIIEIQPVTHLTPVTLVDPGTVTRVRIHSFAAGVVPLEVARGMASAAQSYVRKQLQGVAVEVTEVRETAAQACGNGSGIIAIAETTTGCLFGESANGERGVPSEETGKNVGKGLVKALRSGGCVDDYLQDQVVIFMALAKGKSAIRTGPLTLHTSTAIHIAQLITKANFTVRNVEGEKDVYLIECEGIGHKNASLGKHLGL